MRVLGVALLWLSFGSSALDVFSRADPDEHLNMTEIVREHGYPIEPHYVHTQDGYVLTAFRIPHGISNTKSIAKRPVVLLQHALLCSSFDWVNMEPHQSLGFILADAGYDVWMGNNRGNTYSMNHTRLPVDSAEFWNFSYDEMALYDVPANVDYILGVTGQESLSYIGHSQGTLQAFAGFSHNATLASKLDIFIALAPVAYVHHQSSPIFTALTYLHTTDVFKLFGVNEFLPADGWLNKIAAFFCAPLDRLCNDAIFLFCGTTTHINATRLPVFLTHTPAGTSVKNMDHWAQGVKNDGFQMYDYGSADKNIEAYGQSPPPAWNVRAMTAKVALFTGANDILADQKDVQLLVDALPPSKLVHREEIPDYAHLDFAWAENAYVELYPRVLSVLRNHSLRTPTFVV